MPVNQRSKKKSRKRPPAPEPPESIRDQTSFKRGRLKYYDRKRFLGKGGFANVYEVKSRDTGNTYAAKCVWKKHITNRNTAKRLIHEIQVHSRLQHKHIIRMERHFEDEKFVYILLEVCGNQSMMELMKRRKRLTEEETRYFLLQCIDAVAYLHNNNIIHRDLKLGNLLLDKHLNIKLADFGLAIQLQTDTEKRTTICGTPNYIAPEVLHGNKNGGHSFEVDIWSLGCIMYTLLVGKPPFETSTLKTTYRKINRADYSFPPEVKLSPEAKNLIARMLVRAEHRPSLDDLRKDPFFQLYIPPFIPLAALNKQPTFPRHHQHQHHHHHHMDGRFKVPLPKPRLRKRPTSEVEDGDRPERSTKRSSSSMESHLRDIHQQMEKSFSEDSPPSGGTTNPSSSRSPSTNPSSLTSNRTSSLTKDPLVARKFGEHLTRNLPSSDRPKSLFTRDPALMPISKPLRPAIEGPPIWVLCWLVCKRYGLGYVLSNHCFGVHFNDSSKMILQPDGRTYHYLEKTPKLSDMLVRKGSVTQPHAKLQKKVSLLLKIVKHISTSRDLPPKTSYSTLSDDVVYIRSWKTNEKATLFRLSNKLVQVNYADHTELLIDPKSRTVTYTGSGKQKTTMMLDDVKRDRPEIREKLTYARDMVNGR